MKILRYLFGLTLLGLTGLCVSVLAVGLFLSWPCLANMGASPAALTEAETVRIPSPSGSTLAGW